MNTYQKYCPNVFVAKCEQEYKKDNLITLTTKYGKENDHIVHNLIGKTETHFFYSITRADGFNSQERALKKIENLNNWALSAEKRSDDWREKSNEGKDFLALAEPIKIGHHSEKRHRALIDRNWSRFNNAMLELKKAESYRDRTDYWESLSKKINLSMPESLEFFKHQLEDAKTYHKDMKDGKVERRHSYSLTYAKKSCNDLEKKNKIAGALWG
ncbi:MAG: DUF3560 domain-containing protein [Flavobacteriales bacterium]|nr:DUF3560 domain-containing protein [Flavobacteriales bacterium]